VPIAREKRDGYRTGKVKVSQTSFLKYMRLAWLSGPSSERNLYRQMAKNKPTRILEIGLGLGVRSLRMFEIARRYCQASEISYTGIDLFESRPADQLSMSMKDAYKLLRQQGVKVKLVPGDALAAMTMTANSLTNTDLIVIDSDIREHVMDQAWKYFPRMMHSETLVLRQQLQGDRKAFQTLTASDLQTRIEKSSTQGKTKAA